MQCLGRIFIEDGHARSVGGIELYCMLILDEISRRITGFEGFEETSHARMVCLGRISIRDGHACGVGGIDF